MLSKDGEEGTDVMDEPQKLTNMFGGGRGRPVHDSFNL